MLAWILALLHQTLTSEQSIPTQWEIRPQPCLWLTTRETSSDLAKMTSHGFSFLQTPRVNKRREGVGLFVSNAFKFTPISLPSQSSFECISGKLKCGWACLNILNIYRPPGPASSFFSELQDLLFYIASLPHDLLLMDDFNLHIESSSADVRQLTGILESFDLNQHVKFPTYIHSHSLDVMIFSKGCDVLSVSPSDAISDHFSVIVDLKIPTDRKPSHTVSWRPSIWKPLRLISKIPTWLRTLTQCHWTGSTIRQCPQHSHWFSRPTCYQEDFPQTS